jgi:GNAT superfamily N-acetyltransferase
VSDNRLLDILTEAALGRPPVANGDLTVLPAPNGPTQAVLGFTAHHVIAAEIDEDVAKARLPRDDLGAPLSATFLLFLAGWLGASPGSLDVLLAVAPDARSQPAAATNQPVLEVWPRDDLGDHPRVVRAARYRPSPFVFADRPDGEPDGVVVLGRGLADRWEVAYEVAPAARGRGLGRRLVGAALAHAPADAPVFAQVAPGNASSLRACLAAGFRPIGAEVLFAYEPLP